MRNMKGNRIDVKRFMLICAVITVIIVIVLFYNGHFYETNVYIDDGQTPLTLDCNLGQLGNQMCTYAVLYGIAVLNNRTMNVMPCNYNKLIQFFDIHASVVNAQTFREQDTWEIGSYLTHKDSHIPSTANIVKGFNYPCSFTFYNHIRQHIKREFTFKVAITEYVQRILVKIKANRSSVTFIGIHVRRTDYLKDTKGNTPWLTAFGGREVDMEFFEKAIRYYKTKYPNALFVVVSDDRPWCRKNLRRFGVYMIEDAPSPAHDLALLANCNHTIMTYGTFGFWGSYLAGGEVVYFDKFLKPNTEFMKNKFQFENMYLPEWIGISTNSSFKQEHV